MSEASAALLAAVKNYLQISWTDTDTDTRIGELIDAGKAYLCSKMGEENRGQFDAPGFPRTLLFEYVRYARDGALDVFENNYRAMILAMGHERMVNAYAISEESTV
jgi:Phage QLRG family, putative DNA packaging.